MNPLLTGKPPRRVWKWTPAVLCAHSAASPPRPCRSRRWGHKRAHAPDSTLLEPARVFPADIRVFAPTQLCSSSGVFFQAWRRPPPLCGAPWVSLVTPDPPPPVTRSVLGGPERRALGWKGSSSLCPEAGCLPCQVVPVCSHPSGSASPSRWPVPQSPRGHQPPVEPHAVSPGTTHRPGVPAVSSQSGKAAAARKERGQEAASGGGAKRWGPPLPAQRSHFRPRSRPARCGLRSWGHRARSLWWGREHTRNLGHHRNLSPSTADGLWDTQDVPEQMGGGPPRNCLVPT